MINRTFGRIASLFPFFLTVMACLTFPRIKPPAVEIEQLPTTTLVVNPSPTDTQDMRPFESPTPEEAFFLPTEESGGRVFDQFIEDLKTGEPEKIVGIYVENILALQVVYQPATDPAFVSSVDEVATYFLMPWQKAGNHGLLAHNYLAGRYFFNLQQGDIITLVFGDGYYMDFEITQIKEFQALQPRSPYSNFVDLETGEQITVSDVFIEVYMGDFHTTLQTCIAVGAETEWGRHFTIAPPL